MLQPHCPRCDEPIRASQPVHWICFFERARYVILIGLGFLTTAGLALCGVLALLMVLLYRAE